MAHTEILTSVFTDIVGFTEKTANQSRVQHRRMLDDHDGLLLPLIKHYGGWRIKSVGDGMLLSFRSPTDAVTCAMAMQDRLFLYNADKEPALQIRIRAALNVGEVSVEKNDIFGDSVNLASRLEGITPEGEVYLTQAVYLAMNKTEVDCELLGSRTFKGAATPVEIYRARPKFTDQTAPPFGVDLPKPPKGLLSNFSLKSNNSGALPGTHWWKNRGFQAVIGVVIAATAVFLISSRMGGPEDVTRLKEDARAAMETDDLATAQELAQAHVDSNPSDAEGLLLVGHVQMARGEVSEALDSYDKALHERPELAHDAELAQHLLKRQGTNDAVDVFIVKWPSPEVIDQLAHWAVEPGWDRRHSAAKLLGKLGEDQRFDIVAMTLMNLREQTECEHRLASIQKLRKFGDKKALPDLLALQDVSTKEKLKNRCFRAELKSAIAELSGNDSTATTDTTGESESGLRKLVKKIKDATVSSETVNKDSGRK
jgi:class 3 adenylate cyclase